MMADDTGAAEGQDAASVDVHDAVLPKVPAEQFAGQPAQIDILMDSTIRISAHLGQVEMEVRDMLQVGPSTVLKLDKQAGEPIDLFLGEVKFATGDLVVIGQQLGIRIREVIAAEGPR